MQKHCVYDASGLDIVNPHYLHIEFEKFHYLLKFISKPQISTQGAFPVICKHVQSSEKFVPWCTCSQLGLNKEEDTAFSNLFSDNKQMLF